MRILIDKHWEEVNDLYDVSKIIREYYNNELANRLDEFIEDKEDEIQRMYCEIEELEQELEANFL